MYLAPLKYHVHLTADRLAELLTEEADDFIPLCECEHPQPTYAEYITEHGSLLCSGCTFCRECHHELLHKECENSECVLYLTPAREKDA